MSSKNGRTRRGRFAKGNRCGRTAGVLNKTTIDIRVLRQRILDSWDAVGGDKILARLAKRDPRSYLKLVASLLPREGGAVQPKPFVVPGPFHTPKALDFIDCLERERIAQGEIEVTPEIVERMLLKHSRGELDEEYNADDPA